MAHLVANRCRVQSRTCPNAAVIPPLNLGEVYGQPDSRLALCCPRHPMGAVSCDQHVIARMKIAFTFAFNSDTRQTGEDNDPFVMSPDDGVFPGA